ncbi:MAG: anthranilate synthase family protein [Photobacterium frigidiphilum]|uniref:anthranilate synthase family protein n=1 Tax=Photobacterium frigidiphilum TaxID=264736 RepID=UPI0030017BCD
MSSLLSSIIASPEQPFALLYRPTVDPGLVDVFQLNVQKANSIEGALNDLHAQYKQKMLLIPFRQVIERNYRAVDDGMPILSMLVTAGEKIQVASLIKQLPETPVSVGDMHFNLDDDQFCKRVAHLIDNEISQGAGSNFVLHRKLRAKIADYEPLKLLSLYRSVLERERSAYWIFIINTGEQAFIGASPELHASLNGSEVNMNPISGTYLYPKGGATEASLLNFLSSQKEKNELSMVVDEELKMMSRLCEKGAQVSKLKLKQLSHVAHTEYILSGESQAGVTEVLIETLPAPTVVGSPVQNACDVITRYEPEGRRYYSGVLAIVDSTAGTSTLDSAIVIRTSEISLTGDIEIGAGATIVRDSNPIDEANETRSKAQSLYNTMFIGKGASKCLTSEKHAQSEIRKLNDIPAVQNVLMIRSKENSCFWTTVPDKRIHQLDHFIGKRILILDGNDTFTSLLNTVFVSLGATAHVENVHRNINFRPYDLVVAGPGPGNPLDKSDPRIIAMREVICSMIKEEHPFFAVCLSHQILATQLGLPVIQLSPSNQGVQKSILLGDRIERVGFYNTFCASADRETVIKKQQDGISLYADENNGQVHAIRGATFSSVQFHLESFMTIDGSEILDRFVKPLFKLKTQQVERI